MNALKDCGLSISNRNIRYYLEAIANMIRKKISDELKNETFSILTDIATKNMRSILGVNTCCVINDKTVIRTISMQQITHRHTSDNIANDIIRLMEEEYQLEPDQVYAFISDNAYNVVKVGEIMDAEAAADAEELQIIPEAEYEDAILNMINDCEFYSDLISNVAKKYAQRNKNIHIKSTNTIGCASHTLHLAVEKGITMTASANNLIKDAREVIKKLRTPTILNRIKTESSYKLPQIDVPTRWNSKFIMVNNFKYFYVCEKGFYHF